MAFGQGSRIVLNIYMVIFFSYMFLPLILMVAAGFNDFDTPSVTVWRGFTLKWFGVLAQDTRMWSGLINSFIIAVAVIAVSLPLGLPALRAAQDQIKELTSENAELKLKLLATEEKPEQLLNGGDIDQVSHVATVGVEPDSASGGEAGSGTPSSNS